MDYSAEHLIRSLSKRGMKFKSFSLTHHGRYSAEDADWNYKDVPHLPVIHQLVEASLASVTEEHVASINLQKILGFRFPVSVYNYHPKDRPQTYFTTLFFYVLIIETDPVAIGPNETKVTTTYNIGATGWWMLLFPLLRWVLKRNYKDLMSGDIPMRNRRGELRDWGYEFKYDTQPCGFAMTIDLSKINTWPGKNAEKPNSPLQGSLSELKNKGEIYLGRDDIYGIRLILQDGKVSAFPRMCPHEGASLDHVRCERNLVRCPWHSRPFAPLGSVEFNDNFELALSSGKVNCIGDKVSYVVGAS